MRYFGSIVVLSLLLFLGSGCDSGVIQRDGLDLTVINQTTVGWQLERTDTGDSWSINGDSWNKLFRCYDNDNCESTFLAKPTAIPPEGCEGWEKEARSIHIPKDRRRTQRWELSEYDLEPLPRGCVNQKTLRNIRKKYGIEK